MTNDHAFTEWRDPYCTVGGRRVKRGSTLARQEWASVGIFRGGNILPPDVVFVEFRNEMSMLPGARQSLDYLPRAAV